MRMLRCLAMICVVAAVLLGGWLASPASAKRADSAGEAGPTKPALPKIESLQLEPSSLTLVDGRDGRQVLIWGITQDGQKFDLSDEAVFKADSPQVAVVDARYLYPAQIGDG